MKPTACCLLMLMLLSPVPATQARELSEPDCQRTTVELYRDVSPAVVSISGMAVDPFKPQQRVSWAVGSGVIVDDEGLVLTNAHLVLELDEVYIATGAGQVVPAELLGADPVLDLAVLRMQRVPGGVAVARLGDSDALQIGEDVIAIGNSLGLERTVSRGIVSGLNRTLPVQPMSWLVPYIQTDAALSAGNSGGPLVNRCGEIIGINTTVLEDGENIGFAVPVNIARRVIPELVEHGRIIRPWHGINGRMLDITLVMLVNFPLVPGFLIETIEPGSAAEKAGLRAGSLPLQIGRQEFLLGGDVITRINDQPLTSLGVLMGIADALRVGDTVVVEYFRDGEFHTAEVTLPERPLLRRDLPR